MIPDTGFWLILAAGFAAMLAPFAVAAWCIWKERKHERARSQD